MANGEPSNDGESTQAERAGRGRNPSAEMRAGEAVRLLQALDAAGIAVWVDGRWGVDALLDRQTRPHDDLDLVVGIDDVPALQRVLDDLGYTFQRRDVPLSFELVDPQGATDRRSPGEVR